MESKVVAPLVVGVRLTHPEVSREGCGEIYMELVLREGKHKEGVCAKV